MSVLSGQPDKNVETLYSNLFLVKRMPEYMYVGKSVYSSQREGNRALSDAGEFRVNLTMMLNADLYSFQNLQYRGNPHSNLVKEGTVRKVPTRDVLGAHRNVVVSMMKREVLACGAKQKMSVFMKYERLFYPSENNERRVTWASKFRASSRVVAKSMYAAQLGQSVFVHPAVCPSFEEIAGKFYLKLDPTYVLTTDGRRPVTDQRQGRVVTRLVYRSYNMSHLNTIRFWIHQLGCGGNVAPLADFVISSDPVTTTSEYGIEWDQQVAEIKSATKNYRPETEPDEMVIERVQRV